MRLLAFILAATAAFAAGPTWAQEPDWDVTSNPDAGLTIASVDFGDSVLAFRCQGGSLDFILTGTPPINADRRTVTVSAGRITAERQSWLTQPDMPYLAAPEPGRIARELKAGAILDIRVEAADETERARRYRLPTPPSASAIDRVLQACDQPLSDERDGLPRLGADDISWARRPTPMFPDTAAALGARSGAVMLNCIVGQDLDVENCRLDDEAPRNAGFGASALRAAEDATLRTSGDPATVVGSVVRFPITFRIQ